jgi:hypothetical protein
MLGVRYHRAHDIVGNRGLALENRGRGAGRPRPELCGSDSAENGTLRRRAEQIVRFARSNILFYDEHVIDLYHRICALYRMG